MSKTFTVQSIRIAGQIQIAVDAAGNLQKLEVPVEANLGTFGIPQMVDLCDELTPQEKTAVETLVKRLLAKITQVFIG